MKHLLFLLVVVITHTALAQEKITTYYDREHRAVSADKAYYRIVANKFDDKVLANDHPSVWDTVKSFYVSNQKLRSRYVTNQWGTKTGDHLQYHENGTLKSRAQYAFGGAPKGEWETWYSNGGLRSKLMYPEKGVLTTELYRYKIMAYSDSTGVSLVRDGNGFCVCSFDDDAAIEKGRVVDGLRDSTWLTIEDDTLRHTEIFDRGIFVRGTYHGKDGDFSYEQIEIMPMPPGSLEDLYRFIRENIVYPKEAVKKRITGKVFVSFVVKPDGHLDEIKVVKNVHPLLDEEALRVVRLLKPWNPGRQHGKPVRVRYVLPIGFNR